MKNSLRELIKEMIRDIDDTEELEEFSSVASIAGAITPLGTDATYPNPKVGKKKKLKEVNLVNVVMSPLTDVNNNGVPDNLETNHFRDRSEQYETSVECLARSFGGSKSPFKNKREVNKFLSWKY
jgi:hypothetical protein